jgi:hypothetical protein
MSMQDAVTQAYASTQGDTIHYGTLYSGSEFGIRATRSMLDEISSRFGLKPVRLTCRLAVEIQPWKREWIQDHSAPDCVFGNAKELSSGYAYCYRLKMKRKVPYVDWLQYGSSCKKWSSLCNNREEFLHAIADAKGCTAGLSSFGFCRAICSQQVV